jgi:putative redox protein
MLTVKENKLIKVQLEGYAPTASLTEVRVRGHSFVIDEPPYRHGTDVGPTPLETLLGALIGCTNVIARRIAMEMKFDLKIDKIDVVGHLDHRGIDRVADIPVPFPTIELTVKATNTGTEQDIVRLREDMNARCPMSVILRQAGSQIIESWKINYVQK